MKTELEKRIIIAEACGSVICHKCWWQIDPDVCHCGSAIGKGSTCDGHNPVPMGCTCGYGDANKRKASEPQCPKYDTIDSIRSAVMQQSEEFQAKFAWQLECTCVKLNFSKPNLYYVHKLTPSDWLNAFVETVEEMKKLRITSSNFPLPQTASERKTVG